MKSDPPYLSVYYQSWQKYVGKMNVEETQTNTSQRIHTVPSILIQQWHFLILSRPWKKLWHQGLLHKLKRQLPIILLANQMLLKQ